MEVTLAQMLDARERRVQRQTQLNQTYSLPIISFSLNMPGPVKDSPLIRRGFAAGCAALDQALPQNAVKYRRIYESITGCEAIYAVDMDPMLLKSITTTIEDTHGLGRLFDMDVLDAKLQKLDRRLVQGKSRDCIVCGAPGQGCASRRSHSIAQLQDAVQKILLAHFSKEDQKLICNAAFSSLIQEVHTTPKPGLVDRRNTGSHRDMDVSTFLRSAQALKPYFEACAKIGMETSHLSPEETFPLLRQAGLQAEKQMFAATEGANTHKGAIYTMGLLCGAAGRLWNPVSGWNPQQLCREVSAMAADAATQDLQTPVQDTFGVRLYRSHGIRGIRGEVAAGLPSVISIGLPRYTSLLQQGYSPNHSGAVTLLHLIAHVQDTCLIHRGGLDGARETAEKVKALLLTDPIPSQQTMEDLDDWFIAGNLSPGGCADLLAAVYFLDILQKNTYFQHKEENPYASI